jgi:hypothetical protein
MWWNSVVKLWEYQCRSVFRCNAKHLPSVMKNTDRGFEDGYDSDGELGPFNGRGYRTKGV